MEKSIWAQPRNIGSIDDCWFYHTMDIPSHGLVHGSWDLRGGESRYLGNVNFNGKRVLEIGTASGHLCFSMEKMGADVVAYDLSEEQEWDTVPYAEYDCSKYIAQRKKHIDQLNNGFWFAHNAYNSNARVVYGTVYEIPRNIGQFDICTFGSILLHLRDPFLALQCASVHVEDTIIVTDLYAKKMLFEVFTGGRMIRFLPDSKTCSPLDGWWLLSPNLIAEFLKILGFSQTKISLHRQVYDGQRKWLYTVVGRRK